MRTKTHDAGRLRRLTLMEEIQNAKGRLTAEGLVRKARDPEHPLHDEFEWDDSVAGHAYRVYQARQLIQSVRVDIEIEDRVVSTVAYVRDPVQAHNKQGYVAVKQLRSEPESALAMLQVEFQRVASSLERAESLAEALRLKPDVVAIATRVHHFRRKLDAVQPRRAARRPRRKRRRAA